MKRTVATLADIMRRVMLLGTSVVVALGFVLPAHAAPPQSQSFTFTALDSMSCAGFDATIERNFTGREAAYFDQQGNVVRLQVLADMRGSVTNSVTGKTVALRGHIQVITNVTTGSTTFVGPVLMGNSQGVGSVIKDTGRIVFDPDGNIAFEAGPHDAIDTDGAVFCSAVS
jgi:hypothetical protein